MAITIVGAFFRFYDFFDLMLFETDQARDYKLINEIFKKGINEFPLVGPKAGGTFFRLGSIYYIPAYLATLVFGVSPYVLTLPEAILSVLAIPLFFLLLREFFNERISFYCAALFAVSLFFTEYAHFSWNPNYIPFFFILALFSMLKYSRDMKSLRWAMVLAVSSGIVMQLHTITLVGMPLIILTYFIILRKRILFKHAVVFLGIILFLFSPLIINDVLTKGENLKEFKRATINKTERDNHPSLGKSVFMNIYNYARYYSIILTSQNQVGELIRVESSKNLRELVGHNISEKELKTNLLKGFLAVLFVSGGFLLLILKFFYLKNSNKGDDLMNRRNFLILIIIVQIIFGLILFPLALRVDSRYFFPVAIIPFVISGLFFSLVEDKFKRGRKIALALFLLLFLCNIFGTLSWLKMLSNYGIKYEKNKEFVLDKYFIITMKQWDGITEKVVSLSDNHKGNIYIQSTPFHINSFRNLLEIKKQIPVRIIDTKNLDSSGMYFFLRESDDIGAGSVLPESLLKRFNIVSGYNFGTVTLIQMKVKENQKASVQKNFSFEEFANSPRCYELEHSIEVREKCKLKDIKYLFGK